MSEEINDIVWKLMVGCSMGEIEPNDKEKYIEKIKIARDLEWQHALKRILECEYMKETHNDENSKMLYLKSRLQDLIRGGIM